MPLTVGCIKYTSPKIGVGDTIIDLSVYISPIAYWNSNFRNYSHPVFWWDPCCSDIFSFLCCVFLLFFFHLSSSCVLCAQYFPSFSGLSILDCPFVFSLKFTLYFIRPHPHRNYQLEMKYNYIFLEVITTESVNIFRKIFITEVVIHWLAVLSICWDFVMN